MKQRTRKTSPTAEDLIMTREEALQVLRERMDYYEREKRMRATIEVLVPEFAEKEDDRIIRFFAELATDACGGPGQEYYEEFGLNYDKVMTWLEKKKEQKSLDISAASEWLREHVCSYMNSEYNEFHKCVEYDGSIDKERLINDFEEAMRKEQKPIKVEVYEVGKGTTVCGQDYKCKKDYKEGSCWYIKDVLYHCSRDGYLTDQNGVSWSCTPEWFNEYIYTNNELADEEKNNFVRSQFLQCKRSFGGFKEGEHYWLEYIGDDMYVGRSDNILNQKFHITPRQLYTLFSQKLEEVQGPPQEEKQISLNYELPFNENPSDNEIIEALIKHLKEQDGFLTAINCVSTKAILDWLENQKDASKAIEAVEKIDKYIDEHLANAHDMKDSNPDKKYYRGWDDALGKMSGILQDVYSNEKQKEPLTPLAKALSNFLKNDFEFFARKEWNEAKWNEVMNTQATELQRLAHLEKQKEQKPVRWPDLTCEGITKVECTFNDEQKEQKPFNVCEQCPYYKDCPDYNEQKPIFRVGDTIMAKDGTGIPQEMFYIERIEDGFYWEKDNTILISNQDEFQLVEPADNVSKEEYVKKFKALCDAYEIKLPNRAYDIYHLCDDLAELFGNTNKQE